MFGGYNCTCVVWSFFSDVVTYACIIQYMYDCTHMKKFTTKTDIRVEEVLKT